MATKLMWTGAAGGPAPTIEAPIAPDDPARKLVGRLLDDRFEIVDVLGRGGMAVVYTATDHVLERPVVVKVLASSTGDRKAGQRLIREARLACRVEHPSIVTVFHLGLLETGEPYVVMEKLVGRDLRALLSERLTLTIDEAIAVLDPVADAIEALHEAKIVHRDLKPDNILVLGARLDRPRVKLIDFGLALLDRESAERLTRAGTLLGTAEYVAPECARGGDATPASDVYALAATAYELVSGVPPFFGQSIDVLVAKTRENAPVVAPDSRDPRIRRAETIFARALSRDPAQRPSPSDFIRQLREAARAAQAETTQRVVLASQPEGPLAPSGSGASGAPTAIAWVGLATGILALITALASLVR